MTVKIGGTKSADSLEMWGIQTDGTSSPLLAIEPLTRSCMGQGHPEIVGCGSSVGFDEPYRKKHRSERVCFKREAKDRRISQIPFQLEKL
jgi:hypothetical protein